MVVKSNSRNQSLLGNLDINVISEYTYLGICFPSNNNFSKGISHLKNQATRVMFSLIKNANLWDLTLMCNFTFLTVLLCQ